MKMLICLRVWWKCQKYEYTPFCERKLFALFFVQKVDAALDLGLAVTASNEFELSVTRGHAVLCVAEVHLIFCVECAEYSKNSETHVHCKMDKIWDGAVFLVIFVYKFKLPITSRRKKVIGWMSVPTAKIRLTTMKMSNNAFRSHGRVQHLHC